MSVAGTDTGMTRARIWDRMYLPNMGILWNWWGGGWGVNVIGTFHIFMNKIMELKGKEMLHLIKSGIGFHSLHK